MKKLDNLIIIRGAGDIATGSIQRLHRSGFKVLCLEVKQPTAIRRTVALSDAIYVGETSVEDITARRVETISEMEKAFEDRVVPLMVDPECKILEELEPDVLVDAILAKKNLGTRIDMAKGTVALGPGFIAGEDVDIVIETNRGHDLGRLIFEGSAAPNTNRPGNIDGFTRERVLYAPKAGKIINRHDIGDIVEQGEVIATVEGGEVTAKISGILRGIIRNGTEVFEGMKIGDVDPRTTTNPNTISDKARALGGATLEAVMILKNRNADK
ncbi:selenium-dependent molybdenum cofactor biosynthesis protein YqeB [Peptoniphilus indolicus]|uniref:YqeB family selenium-dependent molybdenum hydroxylase system protein n=2 Tax=Peptoniphilus indolicus TaxID=33030 RepID=G4D3K1_9FIRM|nr:selenium-dependent molybdenum cofactor biosynthesis protein YqeB [Peptoniphilus indolicus]EGY79891.1 YqeB family selenium-dependent molybdenum hydroxylase system protein [Peptoniphilus indolicus ATCC 29427]SUB75679.1 selenium-dependent molybdenum hydroxylase system protein, YqeB family [Peptoniphilus indolicus]